MGPVSSMSYNDTFLMSEMSKIGHIGFAFAHRGQILALLSQRRQAQCLGWVLGRHRSLYMALFNARFMFVRCSLSSHLCCCMCSRFFQAFSGIGEGCAVGPLGLSPRICNLCKLFAADAPDRQSRYRPLASPKSAQVPVRVPSGPEVNDRQPTKGN